MSTWNIHPYVSCSHKYLDWKKLIFSLQLSLYLFHPFLHLLSMQCWEMQPPPLATCSLFLYRKCRIQKIFATVWLRCQLFNVAIEVGGSRAALQPWLSRPLRMWTFAAFRHWKETKPARQPAKDWNMVLSDLLPELQSALVGFNCHW